MGNLTYALSICVSSMEMEHLIANASWLAGKEDLLMVLTGKAKQRIAYIGSTLTVLLDVFVSELFQNTQETKTEKVARCSDNLHTIDGRGRLG